MEGNNPQYDLIDTFRSLLMFMFFMMLMNSTIEDSTNPRLRMTEEEFKARQLFLNMQKVLSNDLNTTFYQMNSTEKSLSGTYYGRWKRIPQPYVVSKDENYTADVQFVQQRPMYNRTLPYESGEFQMRIVDMESSINHLHAVSATVSFSNKEKNDDQFLSLNLNGMFFVPTRRLTLFANTAGGRRVILWKNPNMTDYLNPHNLSSNSSSTDFDPHVPIRSLVFPFTAEHSLAMLNRCFYRFDSSVNDIYPNKENKLSPTYGTVNSQYYNFTGGLSSSNCGQYIEFELDGLATNISYLSTKTRWYSFFTVVVTFIECLVYISELDTLSSISQQSRLSLNSIGLQCILDAILSLFHMSLAIGQPFIFQELVGVTIHKFFLAIFVELRLYLIVWKSQNNLLFEQGFQQIRKQISLLYIKLYVFLLLGMILLFNISIFTYVLLAGLFSFWIPQIVSNFLNSQRPPYSYRFIITITISRTLLLLYLSLCPYNLYTVYMGKSLNMKILLAIVLFTYTQGVLLVLQKRYGPFCFVPKVLRPNYYDYHRIPVINSDEPIECVICMCDVDLNDHNEYMVTPCNHIFHKECLSHWLEIKPDCPTCRRVLPDVL
ncbi:hypothetical protein WA158_004322 [Blastocystis sp. Blastoise]